MKNPALHPAPMTPYLTGGMRVHALHLGPLIFTSDRSASRGHVGGGAENPWPGLGDEGGRKADLEVGRVVQPGHHLGWQLEAGGREVVVQL
jgi:hypothetical protein